MTSNDPQHNNSAANWLLDLQQLQSYAILQLDGDGRILGCNSGVTAVCGYLAEELHGRDFSCLFSEADVERGVDRAVLSQAFANTFEQTGLAMVRKDGSRFRAALMLEQVASGTAPRLIMVVRDITRFFQAEKRVRDAQEITLRAQRLDAISKLTLGLSHDFNNLLSVIGNSLDMLAIRRNGDERARHILDIAQRAVERGTQLTRQMLAFGRGQVLVPQQVDLSAVLRSSLDLYERICGESICLHLDVPDALPPVALDVGQFEAALLNLLGNSRDALQGMGKVLLEARIENMVLPSSNGIEAPFVCITVGDSGPGIQRELQEKVFEPFFTTKQVGDGSGLGLSQVYGFAAQSGGIATVGTSALGGAAVSMYFPVAA